MSTKISLLLLLLLTETEEAEELMVLGLNSEKLLIFLMSMRLVPLESLTTSLAIRGFMCEVLVSCG
jgi:hypothetical protein